MNMVVAPLAYGCRIQVEPKQCNDETTIVCPHSTRGYMLQYTSCDHAKDRKMASARGFEALLLQCKHDRQVNQLGDTVVCCAER